VRVAGSGERDWSAGTSENTDRVSDLLKRERERASVVIGIGVAFCGERASGVGRIRHRRDNNMHLRCEKKGDPGGNHRRCILQACISSTKLSVTDTIARYQYGNDQ
jgi:hypothetical protein